MQLIIHTCLVSRDPDTGIRFCIRKRCSVKLLFEKLLNFLHAFLQERCDCIEPVSFCFQIFKHCRSGSLDLEAVRVSIYLSSLDLEDVRVSIYYLSRQ